MYRLVFRASWRALALAAALLCAVPAVAAASVVHVSPGDDIQTAIDRVSANGGGIVQLAPGTHFIDHTIRLRSGVSLHGSLLARASDTVLQPREPEFDRPILATMGAAVSDITLWRFKLRGTNDARPGGFPLAPGLHDNLIGVALHGPVLYEPSLAGLPSLESIRVIDVEVRNCAIGISISAARNVLLEDVKLHQNTVRYRLLPPDPVSGAIQYPWTAGNLVARPVHGSGLGVSGLTVKDSELVGGGLKPEARHAGMNIEKAIDVEVRSTTIRDVPYGPGAAFGDSDTIFFVKSEIKHADAGVLLYGINRHVILDDTDIRDVDTGPVLMMGPVFDFQQFDSSVEDTPCRLSPWWLRPFLDDC
jgi:hypothetical protein